MYTFFIKLSEIKKVYIQNLILTVNAVLKFDARIYTNGIVYRQMLITVIGVVLVMAPVPKKPIKIFVKQSQVIKEKFLMHMLIPIPRFVLNVSMSIFGKLVHLIYFTVIHGALSAVNPRGKDPLDKFLKNIIFHSKRRNNIHYSLVIISISTFIVIEENSMLNMMENNIFVMQSFLIKRLKITNIAAIQMLLNLKL